MPFPGNEATDPERSSATAVEKSDPEIPPRLSRRSFGAETHDDFGKLLEVERELVDFALSASDAEFNHFFGKQGAAAQRSTEEALREALEEAGLVDEGATLSL